MYSNARYHCARRSRVTLSSFKLSGPVTDAETTAYADERCGKSCYTPQSPLSKCRVYKQSSCGYLVSDGIPLESSSTLEPSIIVSDSEDQPLQLPLASGYSAAKSPSRLFLRLPAGSCHGQQRPRNLTILDGSTHCTKVGRYLWLKSIACAVTAEHSTRLPPKPPGFTLHLRYDRFPRNHRLSQPHPCHQSPLPVVLRRQTRTDDSIRRAPKSSFSTSVHTHLYGIVNDKDTFGVRLPTGSGSITKVRTDVCCHFWLLTPVYI